MEVKDAAVAGEDAWKGRGRTRRARSGSADTAVDGIRSTAPAFYPRRSTAATVDRRHSTAEAIDPRRRRSTVEAEPGAARGATLLRPWRAAAAGGGR